MAVSDPIRRLLTEIQSRYPDIATCVRAAQDLLGCEHFSLFRSSIRSILASQKPRGTSPLSAPAAAATDRISPPSSAKLRTKVAIARFAHRDVVEAAATADEQATNRVLTGRAVIALSAIRSVEKAMDVAGDAAFC